MKEKLKNWVFQDGLTKETPDNTIVPKSYDKDFKKIVSSPHFKKEARLSVVNPLFYTINRTNESAPGTTIAFGAATMALVVAAAVFIPLYYFDVINVSSAVSTMILSSAGGAAIFASTAAVASYRNRQEPSIDSKHIENGLPALQTQSKEHKAALDKLYANKPSEYQERKSYDKVRVAFSPRVLHEPDDEWGKFTKGAESVITGTFKNAGMDATMTDHKNRKVQDYIRNNEAFFAFGASADIAQVQQKSKGLHPEVKARLKFEQEAAKEAIRNGKVVYAACGGMQGMFSFLFGRTMTESIPGKKDGGQIDHNCYKVGKKNYEVSHDVIIDDEHSIMGQVAKEFGTWDNNTKTGRLPVNSIHQQGFRVEEFHALQKDLEKFFDGKPPFTVNLSAKSPDGYIETIEVRERGTEIPMMQLYQFHPEYTRKSIDPTDQSQPNAFEKVGDRIMEITRDKIKATRDIKPSQQTIDGLLNYFEHVKKQGKDLDKIHDKKRSDGYDVYKKQEAEYVITK